MSPGEGCDEAVQCIRLKLVSTIILVGAIKVVHTAPWPHCARKIVFSDRRSQLYDKSISLRCDSKLFHSLGPAAAKVVTKAAVLWVCVTMHAWLSVQSSHHS